MILAIPHSAAQALIPSTYKLLPVDQSLFPQGFPNDAHPLLLDPGYQNEIRTKVLGVQIQIDAMMDGSIYVPFVDRLGDGKSAFLWKVQTFISGLHGHSVAALVPGKPYTTHTFSRR
jgi:hypothetical protein